MNKKITNAYHRLSLTAQKALNADDNLDWCGFAKWASHRVGQDLDPTRPPPKAVVIADEVQTALDSILNHPLLRALETLIPLQNLKIALHHALEELVSHDVSAEDRLAAKALRASNALIFGEIGSVFARLIERLGKPDTTQPQSEEKIHEIANEIVPAPPDIPGIFFEAPIDSTMLEQSQSDHLVWAVGFYLRAAQETDQALKGELMLAGSMAFTQYEQQRVDHLVTIATCVPIRSKLIDFLNDHLPGPEAPRLELLLAKRGMPISWTDLLPIILGLKLPSHATNVSSGEKTRLMSHIIILIEEKLISALTQHVFFLEIGDQSVGLGLPEQLPHDPPAKLIVPTLTDVKGVMDLFNIPHKPPTWIDLCYRLEFIGKYFAAYQRDPNPHIQQNPELQQEADSQQDLGARGEPPPPV
ncbi:MAG: hypothetical protein ACRDRS_10280 [Pseudonocardiaceae bacterium]